MKRMWLLGLAAIAGIALLGAQPTFAKDKAEKVAQKRTANKPVAPEGKSADATSAEGKPHLPANFAKLNLTPEQDQKVRAVVQKYSADIKSLQEKIASLHKQRETELSSILTDQQKKQLADARMSSQKKGGAEKGGEVKAGDKSDQDKAAAAREALKKRRAARRAPKTNP